MVSMSGNARKQQIPCGNGRKKSKSTTASLKMNLSCNELQRARKQQIPYGNGRKKSKSKNESAAVSRTLI
jgi:hypothetical protein